MDIKLAAAKEAVSYVEDGMVVGLGSGSTVSLMIYEIVDKDVTIIPASSQTYLEAIKAGLKLSTLDKHPCPDLYLDGFDQVDIECNMIKGGGAALLREKVLAAASRKRIFAGEYSKLVKKLNKSVPLEVVPFALGYVLEVIKGMAVSAVIRSSQAKNGPTVTDNGNYIIDVNFGEIVDPEALEQRLRRIPGVVENGLFVGLADKVIISSKDGGLEVLESKAYKHV